MLFIIFSFLIGIVIGSFLNVCITRIPEEVSIVAPTSRCPKCLTPIKPYDNLPVFSWLVLRGKCRSCGTAISPMYPLVELFTGLIFVACYLEFGLSQAAVKWIFFACLIIVLTVTDLRVRLLPDLVTWPGFALGIGFAAFVPPADEPSYLIASFMWRHFRAVPNWRVQGVIDALLGAAFGSLLLWGSATIYKMVRHREGMGLGDVKMMAMAGAFLGVRDTFLTILLGTVLGTIIGIAVIATMYARGVGKPIAERASRRGLGTINGIRWAIASQYQLPLGSFLGVAALIIVFGLSSSFIYEIPPFR